MMTDKAFSLWMAVAVLVVVMLMSTPMTNGSLRTVTARLFQRVATAQPAGDAGVTVAQN